MFCKIFVKIYILQVLVQYFDLRIILLNYEIGNNNNIYN